jgi:hypothetical protein
MKQVLFKFQHNFGPLLFAAGMAHNIFMSLKKRILVGSMATGNTREQRLPKTAGIK